MKINKMDMNRVITIFLLLLSVTGYTQKQQITPVFQTGHYSRINQIAFHADNQHLVSGADDGRLVVWDIYLGLQFHSILVDQSGIKTFSFLTDSSLITLTNNGKIQQWSFPKLAPLSDPVFPTNEIQDFTVINDSTIAMVGSQVYLYELYNEKLTPLNYTSKAYFSTVSYQKERNEIAVSGPVDNYCTSISLTQPYQYKRYVLGNINLTKYIDENTLLLAETNGSLVTLNLSTEKKVHMI